MWPGEFRRSKRIVPARSVSECLYLNSVIENDTIDYDFKGSVKIINYTIKIIEFDQTKGDFALICHLLRLYTNTWNAIQLNNCNCKNIA